MRKYITIYLFIDIILVLTSCEHDWDNVLSSNSTDDIEEVSSDDTSEENTKSHEEEDDYTWDEASASTISLNNTSITANSDGVTVNESTATITAVGNYIFNGTLTDGQIHVNTEEEGTIRLILNGVNITNSTLSPIFIESATKVIVILVDETKNYLTDGSSYTFDSSDEDEPNATLFSKSNLTIYGNGSLTIDANYNDGITSKDGLIINGGTIDIDAADDGIRGKDYLIIEDGTISINANGDGLKSDNDKDDTKGYISIYSGSIDITSGSDGIDAETDIIIETGDINIDTGSGSGNYYSTSTGKGIKSGVSIVIDDGNFVISSGDDAIHSNDNISINGGTFTISSSDDGIHADSELGIYGGEITISKSYEGIESAIISINAGTIYITSNDDGLNAGGGNDGSSMVGWTSSGNYCIYINGGYIYINATGDGIDSNGSVEMADGTVIVNGPTSSNNGALDYNSSFSLSGGFLVAVGSSGMAEAPSSSSSQFVVSIKLASTFQSGTLFHIETSDGDEILTFAPTKSYQSVIFSSSELSQGTSYIAYYGGSSTGEETDGLYSEGNYSGGTQYKSFTISNTITSVSGSSSNPGGGGNTPGGR